MSSCFVDRVYVITGAANGIGRATAALLIDNGARVVLGDIDEGELASLANDLGDNCLYRSTDVSNGSDNKALVSLAVDTFGKIDGAVLNVGIFGKIGNIIDTEESVFDEVLAVNTKGSWLGLKHLIPAISKGGGGAIVMTGSTAGFRAGAPGRAPYVTSKHGVIGLMRAAAAEAAPLGIRVNAVSPGGVNTRMTHALRDMYGEEQGNAMIRQFAESIPLKRLAEPEDVAEVILFLLSDASRYCTASNIMVDGGLMG